jgi:orotate phosphoribosyltransferase
MFEHVRKEGKFILSSGRRSRYFYDFHLLDTSEWEHYVNLLKVTVDKDQDYDVIVAPATGGIIPGFVFAKNRSLPLLIVEKTGEVKGPKIGRRKFLIVDDVVTSLKTVRQSAIQVLIENPTATLVGAASFIFRGNDEDLASDIPLWFLERKEVEE